MADRFKNYKSGIADPISFAFEITPGTGDLDHVVRALYIGTGGDLSVQLIGFNNTPVDVIFKNVPVGIFPVRAIKVYAANTTADDIVGLV